MRRRWPLINSNKKGNFVLHHLVLINSSTKKVSIFLNDFSLFLPPDSFSKLYNYSNQEFSLGKLKTNHLNSYLSTLVPLEDWKSKKGQLHIRCMCDAGNMSSHLFLRQKTCKFYCLFLKQINFLLRILRHPDDKQVFHDSFIFGFYSISTSSPKINPLCKSLRIASAVVLILREYCYKSLTLQH